MGGAVVVATGVVRRYCHVYREGELERLFGEIGGTTVTDSWYDSSNWIVVVEKAADKR